MLFGCRLHFAVETHKFFLLKSVFGSMLEECAIKKVRTTGNVIGIEAPIPAVVIFSQVAVNAHQKNMNIDEHVGES
jgi:hypothetical protein